MRIYVNFKENRRPYGGANAFLRALCDAFRARGASVTNDPSARFDVALLNALTEGLDLAAVERIAERGRPVVHRKVGYRVSGTPELRAEVEGVVRGDALQIEFTPYLAHTIFQSEYSRDVFVSSGFDGPFTVIRNGVDDRVFNQTVSGRWGRRGRPRTYWDGVSPLRVIVSTWSTDENKGFADYEAIDERFAGRTDVRLALVGRTPDTTRFETFDVLRPQRRNALGTLLKRQHVLLQLARFETCSNALIEGINCGLPAVYLDSGSNAELAAPYGVEFTGDLDEAIGRLRSRYADIVRDIPDNPYRVSSVVDRYLAVLESVL